MAAPSSEKADDVFWEVGIHARLEPSTDGILQNLIMAFCLSFFFAFSQYF